MNDPHRAPARPAEAPVSKAYELFMGLLSALAIGVALWRLVSRDDSVEAILAAMDNLFCVLFLADFARSVRLAPDKRAYLAPWGVFDLLGSIPGIFWLRLFRVSRLARVLRSIQGRTLRQLTREFLAHRQESAIYVISLAAILVLLFGSTLMVRFEADAPGSNIRSAGDALWWAVVTITTVGYGDRYPVTEGGRAIAVLTMATGIGIFGVATSSLSSVFLGGRARPAALPEVDEAEDEDRGPVTAMGPTPAAADSDVHVVEPTVSVPAGVVSALTAEVQQLRLEVSALRAERCEGRA